MRTAFEKEFSKAVPLFTGDLTTSVYFAGTRSAGQRRSSSEQIGAVRDGRYRRRQCDRESSAARESSRKPCRRKQMADFRNLSKPGRSIALAGALVAALAFAGTPQIAEAHWHHWGPGPAIGLGALAVGAAVGAAANPYGGYGYPYGYYYPAAPAYYYGPTYYRPY
jgi:hypothetical protein